MVSTAVSRTLRYLAGMDNPDEEEQSQPGLLDSLGQGISDLGASASSAAGAAGAALGQGIRSAVVGAPPPPPNPDQGPWEQPYPGTVSPIRNPDGSVTTERSITVTEPDLNAGQATNIPTVWSGQVVDDDTAITNARNAGGSRFPAFGSIDEAVSAAEQRSRDLGAGQATSIGGAAMPQATVGPRPQYSGPSYAQPSLAPGQPSMLEQLPEVGRAGLSRAAETLGDRGALLSGLRRPETALEVAEQAAPAPARAVQIASEVGSSFGAGAGRRFAEGTVRPDEDVNAPLFTTPQVGPIPAYPVTRGDVGAAVGTVLGDPTTYLGFGAAGRAADAPVDAAMRAAGRGIRSSVGAAGRVVGGALDANAARTAEASARMAAEGSTTAPGVFGLSGLTPDEPLVQGMRPRIIPEDVADPFAIATRAISEPLAGSIGGATIGAGLPAETEEERRQNALRGAGLGAVGFPVATRAARGLSRLAGAVPTPESGALGLFGAAGRPASQAASAAPNPIMQRMAQQMAGQYQPSAVTNKRGLGERWAQAMTDDRAGLRHFQEAVSKSLGRPLSASESVAELTRVNPASVASQRIDEGIKGALQSVGEDEDYLSMYLVHSHNVDVAREIGQRAHDAAIAAGRSPRQASQEAIRAANTRQFSGDLRLGETLQQLTDIEQRVKSLPDGTQRWQAIQDGAQQIWDFNKATLERKRDAGIISDDLYNELTTRYPKYVRTDIADYFDKGTGGPAPAGKRLGVSDIGIQKISATGTAKERVNPLLSTIDQTYASEAAIARNEAGKAFEELIRLDPAWQSTFKEVVPAQGVNVGNPATSVPASYTLKNGEQFLRVWDGGQARTYVIPKEYAALVSPQTGRVLGDSGAAKAAQEAMNIYKSLITSKNPAFSMVVSPLRDAGDYAIREATLSAKDQGLKGAAQAIGAVPGVMADYARAIPDAFRGILEGTYKGDLGRMMSEGAGQISRPGREQGELRAALGELQRTNGLEVKSVKDAMRLVGNVLTLGAEPIGGRIEQIPRLAAARRAGRRGASDLGQAMSFRDATVDFQRAGEVSRVINSIVPFFNVAMQGGAQTVRTFKANPAAFMASVAGTVGTATIAAEAWNNADPQRAADYEDVPDYLKRTGLVVMLPGVEGQSARGDALPNYVWIPVGQYGALVQTAKEAAKNAVAGKPGADLSSPAGWLELGAEVAGIFSPIRGESAGGMISSLIPPGLSTAAELSANRDLFRGSTIATERRNEQASALSQASAAGFNTLTGQESQPSQWEYLYKDLGGYGATLALEASNLAAEKLGMRPPKADVRPIQDIPIVGGLVNRVIRDAGGQRLEDATEQVSTVPESIRPILTEVGLRRDQIAPVGSRYRGAQLSREEQERWQSATNAMIEREVMLARRTPEWRERGADKAQLVQDAVGRAKDRAAERALRRLTDDEIERRKQREESRKAG